MQRRRSVPNADDIEPPDRQAIRMLVNRLSRLVSLGLQTWNEAAHFKPFDQERYYEKVQKLKRLNQHLAQENAQIERTLEESPGGALWKGKAEALREHELREKLVTPLRVVEAELEQRLREVQSLVTS